MGILIFNSGGGSGGNPDYSVVNATPEHVVLGRRFRDNKGVLREGRIPSWTGQVKSGSSQDGNKIVVSPSLSSRHIQAGSYLNHDIELAPMPEGSVTMSRDGNAITLAKEAGYIPNGTRTLLLPTYSGDVTFTPGVDNIVIPVGGKFCPANITILGEPQLQSINIREGASIFGKDGSFTGEPAYAEGSLTPENNKTWTIYTRRSADPSYFAIPYMFGFVCHSTVANQVVSGMGYRGKADVRCYVAGQGAGWVITANWYSDNVKLTINESFNSYVFNTSTPYTVWVAYKPMVETL